MGDEGVYSNEHGSIQFIQCRTNTLKLRLRQGFEGGAVDCLLCGGGEETMRHFFMECGQYNFYFYDQPYILDIFERRTAHQ